MSDQYPRPGQPGEQPPTQIAGQGGVPPQGYPQQGQPGGYPQQPGQPGGYPQQPGQPGGYPQQPGQPGGYPGGGYGGPGGPGGPGYPAPPTGGGGSKKGLIIGIVVAVVAIVLIGGGIGAFFLFSGGDDDDSAKDKVTKTATVESSETSESTSETTEPTEEVTTEETTDTGTAAGDPNVVAEQYLEALIEGDCATVEELSTDIWFQGEYGDAAGCASQNPMGQMSAASYDFEDPFITGDSATVSAVITAPDGTEFYASWIMTSESGTWLVEGFAIIEG